MSEEIPHISQPLPSFKQPAMAIEDKKTVVLASLLDTDLYKFTMQQAVLRHFPETHASYRFTHRDSNVYFTRECYEAYIQSLPHFAELRLTDEERAWLGETCPYFNQEYLDYLSNFRFKPEQVSVTFSPTPEDDNLGRLEIEAVGPWVETILWEVPLMAVLSELYFKTADTDWTYDEQREIAYKKAQQLLEAGCVFSEFGTRRRRSYHIQDLVVETLIRAEQDMPEAKGKVFGTSPSGSEAQYSTQRNYRTVCLFVTTSVDSEAHTCGSEWFMGVGALRGYEHANGLALDLWEAVYPGVLLLALTDTFSTEAFYKDFVLDTARARRWQGLRQDSGDPYVFAPRAKEIYESLGIDYRDKMIIFSDALNLEKALKLKKQCDEIGFKSSFGIGTFLTNDFQSVSSHGKEKSKALNMVIKLASVDDKPCVKISDELTKNTGDPETVKHVKNVFDIRV